MGAFDGHFEAVRAGFPAPNRARLALALRQEDGLERLSVLPAGHGSGAK
jgi:hypothetical protein